MLTYNVKWQMTVQRREQISALTRGFFCKEKILAQTVLSRWGCVILNRFESLLDSAGPTELVYKLSQVSSARREKASLLVQCKPDRGQVCLYSPSQRSQTRAERMRQPHPQSHRTQFSTSYKILTLWTLLSQVWFFFTRLHIWQLLGVEPKKRKNIKISNRVQVW